MLSAKQPLVTIVIPTYNGLPYLKEAIESILSQTYPNIELIVLDDGSDDGTKEFLEQYRGKFYYESHENMGQANTLNKGWRMAKGEVIGYLSADDTLMPNAVETSIQHLLNDSNTVLVYPDNYLIDNNSHYIKTYRAPDYNYYAMIENAACQIGVGAFMLKQAYEKAGGWNPKYRYIPDYEHQVRLSQIGNFKHIPKVLGNYRIHEKSTLFGKVSYSAANETVDLFKSLVSLPNHSYFQNRNKRLLGKAYLISSRIHWRSGRYRIGLHYFGKAIFFSPRLIVSIKTYHIILNALLNRNIHRAIRLLRSKIIGG